MTHKYYLIEGYNTVVDCFYHYSEAQEYCREHWAEMAQMHEKDGSPVEFRIESLGGKVFKMFYPALQNADVINL